MNELFETGVPKTAATDEIAKHYKEIIRLLGENVTREVCLKRRNALLCHAIYDAKGYSMNPEEVLRSALFEEKYQQMVIVKDIDFFSMCEHHVAVFRESTRCLHSQQTSYRFE